MEEYLGTSYPDLDREYRDGEVVERTLPDLLHSRAQSRLAAFFERQRNRGTPLLACTELRVKLTETRCLIPDVAVFSPSLPAGSVPSTPPLIAIEIASPDDSFTEIREKLEEYRRWGVVYIWLVDPHARRLYVCTAALSEVASFHLPEFDLHIGPEQIFD